MSLYDALELCALIAEQKSERLERAAIRWHGRNGDLIEVVFRGAKTGLVVRYR